MCGIWGMVSESPTTELDLAMGMRDTLRHRGPDGAGLWTSPDGCVVLAHRRLAIIDLSPAGYQPMADWTGQLRLIFNGEIYNYTDLRRELEARGHRFRTATDTEVILEAYRAWGVDCLTRLNGMFAFALYDSGPRRLFLARDRAGEKPLFYWHCPGRLVFASELKALMRDEVFPRELDLRALEYYLAYGYVPGEVCILKGVRKLPPAHAMTYDLETAILRVWRYWQLPEPCVPKASAGELLDELETLLEDSVRRRLVADVPVGVLLSGGIDSSLVTAMAARVSRAPVKTYTISCPGHSGDEGPYAQVVARHFGTEHTELAAEPAAVALLPELAKQYDEPLADSSMVPTYLVSRLIRRSATVAIGGDGADELFGGYPHYGVVIWGEHLRRVLPASARKWVSSAATRALPVGFRGRHHLIGLAGDASHGIAHINLYFDCPTRRRLLAPLAGRGDASHSEPEAYRAGLCRPGHTVLRQATEADFQTTMGDGYLVKVDRASMLNSLEMRAPWLDYRIIEFAFARVPDHLRVTATERKILPRRLARRLLPSTLDLSRKRGFSIPLGAWFNGEWGVYMESVLSEAGSELFDRRVIRELVDNQRRGYANTARLFALTMFELWRRAYRVTVPN